MSFKKYNPKNTSDRHVLAGQLLDLLVKWGFSIEKNAEFLHAWEFICSRKDKFNPNKTIIIFTSIEKSSGCVRKAGKDMIRIIVKYTGNEQEPGSDPRFYRICSVKRTGNFKSIKDRVCAGIVHAQQHRRSVI